MAYDTSYWRKRKLLNEIKLERGCADCGYAGHPAALDFDHVKGEKKFQMGGNVHRAWSKILAEIEKCEVVCANCHRIRTQARRKK